MQPNQPLPVHHSVLAADSLIDVVRNAYDWNTRSNNIPSNLWEAVLQGYQSVRPLTQAEQAAIPALIYARHIWLMGANTRARERFGDAWLSDFFWMSRIQTLKQWLAEDMQ